MDYLSKLFKDSPWALFRNCACGAAAILGLYSLRRIGYNWYIGKYFKPKVYEGQFRGCTNLFYYEYKLPITEISKYFYRFFISIYTNPGLNPNMGKSMKYKWRLWTFYFDDASKLRNPADFRTIIAA
jgi:hypothetical protein